MQFQLPEKPNLEYLKKQAKKLLAQARAKAPEVENLLNSDAQLSDAQYFLAKSYGFSSWSTLKEHVEGDTTSPLKRAIADIAAGKMCILFDDEGRENEGDFVFAAEKATADNINFISRNGRGTICVALSKKRATQLGIDEVRKTSDSHAIPNFGQSLDIKTSHTGVSTSERAQTISHMMDDLAESRDFRSPGHVFTLIETSGGLKKRKGHTEGSLELIRRAGLKEGAVICEIMNDDGSMARIPELMEMAKTHEMELIRISDL